MSDINMIFKGIDIANIQKLQEFCDFLEADNNTVMLKTTHLINQWVRKIECAVFNDIKSHNPLFLYKAFQAYYDYNRATVPSWFFVGLLVACDGMCINSKVLTGIYGDYADLCKRMVGKPVNASFFTLLARLKVDLGFNYPNSKGKPTCKNEIIASVDSEFRRFYTVGEVHIMKLEVVQLLCSAEVQRCYSAPEDHPQLRQFDTYVERLKVSLLQLSLSPKQLDQIKKFLIRTLYKNPEINLADWKFSEIKLLSKFPIETFPRLLLLSEENRDKIILILRNKYREGNFRGEKFPAKYANVIKLLSACKFHELILLKIPYLELLDQLMKVEYAEANVLYYMCTYKNLCQFWLQNFYSIPDLITRLSVENMENQTIKKLLASDAGKQILASDDIQLLNNEFEGVISPQLPEELMEHAAQCHTLVMQLYSDQSQDQQQLLEEIIKSSQDVTAQATTLLKRKAEEGDKDNNPASFKECKLR